MGLPTKSLHKIAALRQGGPLLLEYGIVPADLLRKLDLPVTLLLDQDGWVDRRISFRVANLAAKLTGDRFFCLHAAENNKFEQLCEWGGSILRSGTVRQAIDNASRYIAHIHLGTFIKLDVDGSRARLSTGFSGELGEDPVQRTEANMLMMRKLLNLCTEAVEAELHLPHDKPANCDEIERLFGSCLDFRADRAELVFDRAILELPMTVHAVTPIASAYTLPPATPKETGGAVMRVLREKIALERPTAASVAAALHMNLRTMQRHLAAWGITFEDLLDGFRLRQAMDDLGDGRYTITDIAFRLGYSDSAHFTRAFRRWTGRSPRQQLMLKRHQVSPNGRSN